VGEFLEIVTPSGVTRRIDMLNLAWKSLLKTAPSNAFIQSEVSGWNTWRQSVADSYLSRVFAKPTLAELDQWLKRYENAYNLIGKGGPLEAPTPRSIIEESMLDFLKPENNGWLYLALGASAVAVGIAIFSR
jgi:hypothetical protein